MALDYPAELTKDSGLLKERLSSYGRAYLGAWPIERIRQHRDAHQEGRVWAGKQLARAMLRSAEVKAALAQRVAPALGIAAVLEGGSERVRVELEPALSRRGLMYPAPARKRVHYDLAMCGLAILQNDWRPRPDGSRWDLRLRPWSLEATEWSPNDGVYIAHTRERGRQPIIHGAGKWTVIEPLADGGFDDGAVIPLALAFAGAGYNAIDRAGSSRAIGSPKLLGKLPPGIAVSANEGLAMLDALETLMAGRAVQTYADQSEVKPLEFTGSGWQIFGDADKSYTSKIFLALTGQDGGASNSGGSYTKALILEGVLFALVEADVTAESTGITTGALRPYAALNYGDPEEAASLEWPLPDPEEDARLESVAKRHKALTDIITARRAAGLTVTQKDVDELAAAMRIPAPQLAEGDQRKELLAYHQRGGNFTRNEIRASRGYPPLKGAKGEELVDELATGPANDNADN